MKFVETWSYSNTGYIILGHIIEFVTGEDYFNYTQSTLLEPAGMMNTTSNNLSSIRNEFNLRVESDYNQNSEAEFSYNRYLNDWVRIYAGVNSENKIPDSYDEFNTVGLLGIKYFTPYMFNVDVSIDHQLNSFMNILILCLGDQAHQWRNM